MNFIEDKQIQIVNKDILGYCQKNLNKKIGIKTRFKTRYKHKAHEIKDFLG